MIWWLVPAQGADWLDDASMPPPPSAVVSGDRVRALVRAPIPVLEARDLDLVRRRDGHTPTRLGLVPIEATRQTLLGLRAEGFEVIPDRRIDLGPAPTATTGVQTQAIPLQARSGSRGAGIKVAVIDTHIDLTHPHFFFPDGGVFDWTDVDGDGELTPGVDGIDLDGDGSVGPEETLEEISASTFHNDPDSGDGVLQTTQGLDPSRDWLFLDLDGNFRRTAGRPSWTDDDPGLGEPTFVPDDVDGDGVIELGEKLWQLGTPVVDSVYWDFTTYRRGQDLTLYMEESGDVDRTHGTRSSGIIVGGQLADQRPLVGLASDAELVFVSREYVDNFVELVSFTDYVADRDVDVVLHEYAAWMGWSMDGTSLLEQLVDDLAEQGMVQVCAAGNLGDSGKHARVEGDGQFKVDFELPITLPWLFVEWHHEGGQPVSCELIGPDGFRMKRAAPGYLREDGFDTWLDVNASPGGRGRSTYTLFGADRQLQAGAWQLDCEGDASVLDVYLLDYGEFNRLATFVGEEPASTMGVPSTAQGCIAVGAAVGQFPAADETPGEVLGFSSRGPALGGQKTIDVIAPHDAFTPDIDRTYVAFSGTSGASPQVAALAVLAKAVDPSLSGFEVKALFQSSADGASTVPDDASGYGGVAGLRAMYGEEPGPVPPPMDLGLEIERLAADGEGRRSCQYVAQGDPSVLIRWDVDYDGLSDQEGGPVALEPGQIARAEGFLDGYRVGSGLITAPVEACLVGEDPRQSCACTTGGAVGWPLSLAWMCFAGLLRRRR